MDQAHPPKHTTLSGLYKPHCSISFSYYTHLTLSSDIASICSFVLTALFASHCTNFPVCFSWGREEALLLGWTEVPNHSCQPAGNQHKSKTSFSLAARMTEPVPKVQLVPGASSSSATFVLANEDHTLGNSLRYTLMRR